MKQLFFVLLLVITTPVFADYPEKMCSGYLGVIHDPAKSCEEDSDELPFMVRADGEWLWFWETVDELVWIKDRLNQAIAFWQPYSTMDLEVPVDVGVVESVPHLPFPEGPRTGWYTRNATNAMISTSQEFWSYEFPASYPHVDGEEGTRQEMFGDTYVHELAHAIKEKMIGNPLYEYTSATTHGAALHEADADVFTILGDTEQTTTSFYGQLARWFTIRGWEGRERVISASCNAACWNNWINGGEYHKASQHISNHWWDMYYLGLASNDKVSQLFIESLKYPNPGYSGIPNFWEISDYSAQIEMAMNNTTSPFTAVEKADFCSIWEGNQLHLTAGYPQFCLEDPGQQLIQPHLSMIFKECGWSQWGTWGALYDAYWTDAGGEQIYQLSGGTYPGDPLGQIAIAIPSTQHSYLNVWVGAHNLSGYLRAVRNNEVTEWAEFYSPLNGCDNY